MMEARDLRFLRASSFFFEKREKNCKNALDKAARVWYIIARKGESNVLNSLPRPDAKIGE